MSQKLKDILISVMHIRALCIQYKRLAELYAERDFNNKWDTALSEFVVSLDSTRENITSKLKRKVDETSTLQTKNMATTLPEYLKTLIEKNLPPVSQKFEIRAKELIETLQVDYPAKIPRGFSIRSKRSPRWTCHDRLLLAVNST